MDSETKKIAQKNEGLTATVEVVKTETDRLLEQEKAVTSEFKAVSDDLKKCDGVINQSIVKVAAIGDAVSQFSEAVQGIQASQIKFSQAATSFFSSVSKGSPANALVVNIPQDDFLKGIDAQIADNEAFIRAWK